MMFLNPLLSDVSVTLQNVSLLSQVKSLLVFFDWDFLTVL